MAATTKNNQSALHKIEFNWMANMRKSVAWYGVVGRVTSHREHVHKNHTRKIGKWYCWSCEVGPPFRIGSIDRWLYCFHSRHCGCLQSRVHCLSIWFFLSVPDLRQPATTMSCATNKIRSSWIRILILYTAQLSGRYSTIRIHIYVPVWLAVNDFRVWTR